MSFGLAVAAGVTAAYAFSFMPARVRGKDRADTKTDVVIIGAGPAGSVAAALLVRRGYKVEMLERAHFPRFSIGESLLRAIDRIYLQEAGLSTTLRAHGFQFKDGAAFHLNGKTTSIYFPDKSAAGPSTTFQVMRADFDNILAKGAAKKGANVHFGQEVIAFESDEEGATVTVKDEKGGTRRIDARFALDASGFGRTLPKLLQARNAVGLSRAPRACMGR